MIKVKQTFQKSSKPVLHRIMHMFWTFQTFGMVHYIIRDHIS